MNPKRAEEVVHAIAWELTNDQGIALLLAESRKKREADPVRKAAAEVLREWDIVAKARSYTLDEVRDWLHVYMADKIDTLRAAILREEK